MKTIVFAGLGEAPGKTAVVTALGSRWRAGGRSVAYVRVGPAGDRDVAFVGGALGLSLAEQQTAPMRFDGAIGQVDLVLVELAGDAGDAEVATVGRALAEQSRADTLLVAG